MISDVKSEVISDYAQIAFGVERSIYDIKGTDIAFYMEYYKYKYFDKMQENINISELYDELFLAFKFNINDSYDTELKTGIIYDKNKNERVVEVELKTRLNDGLIFNGKLLNMHKKDNSITFLLL